MQARVWCFSIALLAACGRLHFGNDPGDPDAGPDDDGALRDGDPDTTGTDAPPACLPSYQLCDGFEGTALDPVWTATSGVTLDSTVAHRGTSSIHIHSTQVNVGQDGDFELMQDTTLPLADPTFYVRAWARFGSLPINNMALIEAIQPSSANEDAVFLYANAIGIYTQFTDQSKKTPTPPPLNTWLCLLWTVHRSTSAGTLQLAGDVATLTINNMQTDGNPALADMNFGIGFAGPSVTVTQPPMDIWFDDIIVTNTPVTCAD